MITTAVLICGIALLRVGLVAAIQRANTGRKETAA